MEEYKVYNCFSARLAGFLCDKGFRIKEMRPNTKKPWLKVFIFDDTDELQSAVLEYLSINKK